MTKRGVAIKHPLKFPYLRLMGSSAAVVGGAVVSTITADPQYAQAGAGAAAMAHSADFFQTLGQTILGTDLYRAFTEESTANRDLLVNHDLRRLVGNAIAECVQTALRHADGDNQRSLKKLFEIIPEGWQVLADHPMLQETTRPVSESQLVRLITLDTSSEGPAAPVLAASEWRRVLKAIAKLNAPKFRFTDSAFDRASQAVEDYFLPMLVEATKRDFANQGEGYAALHLRMLSEILQSQKNHVTAEAITDELKTQWGEQLLSFSQVAKTYWDGIADQIQTTAEETDTQAREHYQQLVRRLDSDHAAIGDLAKQLTRIENALGRHLLTLKEVQTEHSNIQNSQSAIYEEQGRLRISLGAVFVDVNGLHRKIDRLTHATENNAFRLRPLHLPPAAIRFCGRVGERDRLTNLLRNRENVTVTGPPGFGKTALASEAVRTVVGDSLASLAKSPFPDGCVFVDLYKVRANAETVWTQLATAVAGPHFRENDPPRTRAMEACRGRQILVVMEGAEEADGTDGRPALPDLASVLSAENRRLVLTRIRTQVYETTPIHLDHNLGAQDAKNLFDSLTSNQILGVKRDRILKLLDGHPLALTWSARALDFEDEDTDFLIREWEQDASRNLSDPEGAERTLEWLFSRSVRRLDKLTRQILTAFGMLAHAPFPIELILQTFDSHPSNTVRQSVKKLIHHGIIRMPFDGHREFSHVLAYQYSRRQEVASNNILANLAECVRARLFCNDSASTDHFFGSEELVEHAIALVDFDQNCKLWEPLVRPLLYDFNEVFRFKAVQRKQLLACITNWTERASRND